MTERMKGHMPSPKTEEVNYFRELLSVLSDEELLRLRRRFQMRNKERMAEILTDEILDRNAL
jgi:hypothetical protein